MSTEDDARLHALGKAIESTHDLRVDVLQAYIRLWQLERWLRRIVYVEFRAKHGDDWEAQVAATQRAARSRDADKHLSHMATPDETILSFSQLSDLNETIQAAWHLFQPYFPPQRQWDARMDEVKQIRHRVAHFRSVHRDDLSRVAQILRDIDDGVWRFCTSYNDPKPALPPTSDPVVAQFLEHDPFPWGKMGDHWGRTGIRDPDALFGMTIELLRRPWVDGAWPESIPGSPGFLYDIALHAPHPRTLNCEQLLVDTRHLHRHLVYIHPQGPRAIRFTIPAVLGSGTVIRILEAFLERLSNALIPTARYDRDDDADKHLAARWPEYVLPPWDDPMSFLSPDDPCSMFGA